MTLERQVMGDFMQSITAEENISTLKIIGVITRGSKVKNCNLLQIIHSDIRV